MIIEILLAKIEPNPWQTRLGEPSPEYIKELALDIAANGLLQLPVARRYPGSIVDTTYQLAFGHNRLAAYKWLNDVQDNSNIPGDWTKMPVDVRTLTDEQMALMAWSENEKRRDVTPIERATAIQRRMTDFGWTNRQCAEALGIDHSTISNMLRLLKLPDDLQAALGDGRLTERQAMALLPMYDVPVVLRADYYCSPQRIVKEALEGKPSGGIRSDVDQLFKTHSSDLARAEFKLDEMIAEGNGVYCGLCRTCDRRMASRNLCFDTDCYHAKTDWVHRRYLEKASQASGYELIDPDKGGNPTSLSGERIEQIIASKCPNLVLLYTCETPRQDSLLAIPGHPHARLVCNKRNNSCTCISGMRALAEMSETRSTEEMPAVDASELEDAARAARKAKAEAGKILPKIKEMLEAQLLQDLLAHQVGALYIAMGSYAYPNDRDLDKLNFYKKMARNAAHAIVPESGDSVENIINIINRKMERLHLDRFELESEPV